MAEAADADDSHGLAGADVGADERGVSGYAGAEEGRGEVRGDGVGDLEGEVLVGADVRGPAAVGGGAVFVVGVVGVFYGLFVNDMFLKGTRRLGNRSGGEG